MIRKGGGVGLRRGDTNPLQDGDATAGPLVDVLEDLPTGDLIERTPLGPLVGPSVELPMGLWDPVLWAAVLIIATRSVSRRPSTTAP